ncbi:MAG: 2-dehydropantoate 2-reductase [Clostridia bacterium]|nr:2-dehydropantoate 2-reductase [Clostridia bacterium]
MSIGNPALKRICIYGVGGVGGYFGGIIAYRLKELRDTNHEVYFIARGSHLQEISKKGLTLHLYPHGTLICKPARAAEKLDELPYMDIIILCVKGYDLEEAIKNISVRIKEDTVVIPLLNGVDIYERIRSSLHKGIVLPGCTYISSAVEGPGVISLKGEKTLIVFGRDPQNAHYDQASILNLFTLVGIDYTWLDDVFPAIWSKYVFIASFALVTGYSGKTIGEVMADTKLRGLVKGIMEEIVQIAKAKGIVIKESVIEQSLELAINIPFDTKTSFQRDLEKKKEKTEGEILGATILRLAKECGINPSVTEQVFRYI